MSTRRFHWPKITRDVVLFTAGMLGMIHETVIVAKPRPELVVAFLGMMGVVAVLRADERRK